MALDVFFRHDAANYLRAAAMASEAAMSVAMDDLDDPTKERVLQAYRQGYFAALTAVGLSFGLEPSTGATIRQVDGKRPAIPSWVEPRE